MDLGRHFRGEGHDGLSGGVLAGVDRHIVAGLAVPDAVMGQLGQVTLQAGVEVVPLAVGLWRPGHFGQGYGAGVFLVVEHTLIGGVLAPLAGFHAQYAVLLIGGQAFGHRVEVVDPFEREHIAGGLGDGIDGLKLVEIDEGAGGHDDVISTHGRLFAGLHAAP